MRQIAYFTTDWNYELVGETLRGVAEYLDQHPDVEVRVFDCFSIAEDSLDDPQVYEIYRLADLSQYDGAVVQTNQIVLKEEAGQLERMLRDRGIPAVTMGIPLGDLPQVKTNDYQAFRSITEHMIDRHGARRLWFLKGPERFDPEESSEARQRRRGFADACRERGIPGDQVRYLEGNWKPSAGVEAAREIAKAEERPDALICANDDMALGALPELEALGIRVPDEVRVTGFDGIFSSSLCTPRLATVDRNFKNAGYRAMEAVIALVEGRGAERVEYNRMRPCLTGSCGCPTNEHAEMVRIKDRFYRQTVFLRQFYLTQDKIASAFFGAEMPEDVMAAIEEFSEIFGSYFLRIYLDERYYRSLTGDASLEEEQEMADGKYSRSFVLMADSRERVARSAARERVSAGGTQRRAEGPLPARERLVQYYPLRYGRIMVGVLMLGGLCAAADMNLHESIVNEMVLSLENTRQRQRLRRMNDRLNDLYVTDQLTGLNNRFGVARYGQPLFDRMKKEERDVAFLFLDIDDMKGINDAYGHEAGDAALRATADALRAVCGGDAYLMRYGGDEFIAFGEARLDDPEETMRRELERICRKRNLSFPLRVSVGQVICHPQGADTLEGWLQAADGKMYEMKKRRKRETEGADAGGPR